MLPKIVRRLRHSVEDALASLMNGHPLPLAEDGLLSNYRLEVLRLNRQHSQALRRTRGASGEVTYQSVRKNNPCEPTHVFEHTGHVRGKALAVI